MTSTLSVEQRHLDEFGLMDDRELVNTFGRYRGVEALRHVSPSYSSHSMSTSASRCSLGSTMESGPSTHTTVEKDAQTQWSTNDMRDDNSGSGRSTVRGDGVPAVPGGARWESNGDWRSTLSRDLGPLVDTAGVSSSKSSPLRHRSTLAPAQQGRGVVRANKPSPLASSSRASGHSPSTTATPRMPAQKWGVVPVPLSPTWVGTSCTGGGLLVPSVSIDMKTQPSVCGQFPLPSPPPLPLQHRNTTRLPAVAAGSTKSITQAVAETRPASWPWPSLAPVWDRPPSCPSVPATFSLVPVISNGTATTITPEVFMKRDSTFGHSPLAAWEEDMPRSTPGTAVTARFDTPALRTPSASPTEADYPIAQSPMEAFARGNSQYSAVSAPSAMEAPSKTRGLFGYVPAERPNNQVLPDDDSDACTSSDEDDLPPVRSIRELPGGPDFSLGRGSIGGDDAGNETTEERAMRLRNTFSSQSVAARSHVSLFSQTERRQSEVSVHKPVERHTSLDGMALKATRVASRDLPELPSRPPTPPPKDDYSGLRSAVLPTLRARQSFASLEAVPEEGGGTSQLRKKKSLGSMTRKMEKQRRRQWLNEPVPAGISSADTFKVWNTKYIRKSMLEPPEPEADEVFSVWRPPSQRRMWEAGTCFIRDENGAVLPFSDLFPKRSDQRPGEPEPRTIVFFVRHFWCGMCQEYITESIARLDPDVLAAYNIRVVIIGDGPWEIIKSYRKILKCPFEVYTDGPRRLYHVLGMIKNAAPWHVPMKAGRAGYNKSSTMAQTYSGMKNGIVHFPFMYPGNMMQLGGEFVLAPGYKCEFAHRMTTISNHMEAPDVLRRAGVDMPTIAAPVARAFTKEQLAAVKEFDEVSRNLVASAAMASQSEAASSTKWQEERNAELERMRLKKEARRGMSSATHRRDVSGQESIAEKVDPGVAEVAYLTTPIIEQPGSGKPIEPASKSKEEMDAAFYQAMVALVAEGRVQRQRWYASIGTAI